MRLLFGRPIPGIVNAIKSLRSRGYLIQALDAAMVVSERHVFYAAEKAIAAFQEGRNVAKDLGIEILRYASGQRQIEKALSLGVSDATERVALLIVDDLEDDEVRRIANTLIVPDDRGSFDVERVRRFYDISDAEIEAAGEDRIPDLVLERVALVDAYR